MTITVDPDTGYELDTLTVTDKNSDKISVIDKNNNNIPLPCRPAR